MKRSFFDCVVAVTCLALLGSFAWHGHHSVAERERAFKLLKRQEAQLKAVRDDRLALEERVSRLRPEHLDEDLLDQVAREMLGFAREDEIVVHLPE